MKMKKLAYMAAIALAFGLLGGLPSSAQAVTVLTLNDTRDLGSNTPPEPANITNERAWTNTLIDLVQGSGVQVVGGQTFNRKNTTCGTCPDAAGGFKSPDGGNGGLVDLGTGGFTYLLGKYDGPHGVDEIWNVQGLTGLVTIPASLGVGLGLSHWTLFGGTTVPDGGTTVMLLGAALGALGMTRRFLKS